MITLHTISIRLASMGAGDLGVASMWRKETDGTQRITARALVWPHKMIHGRVYGDESRFKAMLIDRGYTENWMGLMELLSCMSVRFTKMYLTLRTSMPTLVSLPAPPDTEGGILLLTDERLAEWRCKNTNGLAGSFCTCVACDEAIHEEDALHDEDGDTWCESCFSISIHDVMGVTSLRETIN